MAYVANHISDIDERSKETLIILNTLGLDKYNMVNPRGLDEVDPILLSLNEIEFQKVCDLTFSNPDSRGMFADAIIRLCTNNFFNEPNFIRLINSNDIAQEAEEILAESGRALSR